MARRRTRRRGRCSTPVGDSAGTRRWTATDPAASGGDAARAPTAGRGTSRRGAGCAGRPLRSGRARRRARRSGSATASRGGTAAWERPARGPGIRPIGSTRLPRGSAAGGAVEASAPLAVRDERTARGAGGTAGGNSARAASPAGVTSSGGCSSGSMVGDRPSGAATSTAAGAAGTGSARGSGTGAVARAGSSPSGSTYPSSSDATRIPRWTCGSTASSSALVPILPTVSPSATIRPCSTSSEPSCASVTA